MLINILGFIGAWLLFMFPLYQGILDINDQDLIVSNIIKKSRKNKSVFRKNISRFLWLIPPLKVHLERERSLAILRSSNNDANFDDIYSLLNKATAWVYVAFAGVLNGIVATNDLLQEADVSHPIWSLVIISLIMIIISIFYIGYRISDHRKQKLYVKAHGK
ncbi:hypothetical protein WR164_14610 [Philodulcilactobacillus myokoensis]|uniref:Uncharacterized protein n=1 Tax=Philodulcilactobacillus myokoensis TaxID=2929573 RepID=A0A9W6ETL6_9LACO|nr:hypothetical protein [Philodulcilactobacillus myokoensis]GLB47482.1 hypothetical protein WR164_14610 [Philodulcilactobacillus myokoensis]